MSKYFTRTNKIQLLNSLMVCMILFMYVSLLIYYRVRYKMLKFWNQSRKAVILLTVLQYFDNNPFCINIRYATF